MKVLGVTGGSAAGKTVVCRILKDLGGKVIDADKVSAKMQQPGTPAYDEIIAFFGQDIILPDGGLNRKALGNIVFHDNEKLKKLNHIVHKYVSAEIKRRVAEYEANGEKFVVLDVPIPVEEGFFDTAGCIWAVIANNDLRVERLVKRMGISEEEAETRISAQMSNREYEELADVVILNETDVVSLKKLVEYELRRFLEGVV